MSTWTILDEIHRERLRQVHDEGYHSAHDDEHDAGDLASAAACYVINAACVLSPYNGTPIDDITACVVHWPWEVAAWKPKSPRRDLVRAAALIVAELERIDRDSTVDSEGERNGT